ncbi:MAG TPA: hypothetical protein GXZ29_08170, partial [Clostridiales bacterium]|nr:hypothetical protein [Clostridiales bacterium]
EEDPEEDPYEEEPPEGPVYVAADITIIDKEDGFGTEGISDAFKFVSNRIKEGSSPNTIIVDGEELELGDIYLEDFVIEPDEITDLLHLGIDGSWQVMDGESRRGFLIFELPDKDFTLQSQFFRELSLAPLNTNFSVKKLLTLKAQIPEEDRSFAEAVSAEIDKVIRQYEAQQAFLKQESSQQTGVVNLIQSADKYDIPFPTLNGVGERLLAEPQTLEEVLALLRNLAWRPSYNESHNLEWITGLSPQAVLTQGWGTEFDLAILAEQLFSRIGLKPEKVVVDLTDAGKEALAAYLLLKDPDKLPLETLPALIYRDTSGKHHVFVIPFMRELPELSGGAYLTYREDQEIEVKSRTAYLTVTVEAVPIGEAAGAGGLLGGLFDGLSGAMGGMEYEDYEDSNEGYEDIREIELLSEELDLTGLSNDAVDIGFGIAEEKAWTAYMETPAGRKMSDLAITKEYYKPVGISITVTVDGEDHIHEIKLNEGENLDGIFVTLGINIPELPGVVLKEFDQAVQQCHENSKAPNELSALRWYTRNILYRFIGAQTVSDDKLAYDLELSIGRTTRTRVIAVNVRRQEGSESVTTNINLVSAFNQAHNGTKEAVDAFNILSGLAVSRMEGVALGEQGYDFAEIWKRAPDDMTFFFVSSDTAYTNIPILKENGFPDQLLYNMEKSAEGSSKRTMFLVPDMPSKIDGQDHWAWLEINCETYETIAVLDTGHKGGFAEYLIVAEFKNPECKDFLEYTVGAMVGVDVGLWSMGAATLVSDDYDEAVELAAAYAIEVSESVHKFFEMVDAVKTLQGLTQGKGTAKKGPVKISGQMDHAKRELNLEVETDFLGFVNGFDAGLAYYFGYLIEGEEDDET